MLLGTAARGPILRRRLLTLFSNHRCQRTRPAAGRAFRRLRRRGRRVRRQVFPSFPFRALRRRRLVAQVSRDGTTETSGGKCFFFSLKVKVFVLQASERTLSSLLSCSTLNGLSLNSLQLKSKDCTAVSLDKPLHLCAKKWSDDSDQFCCAAVMYLKGGETHHSSLKSPGTFSFEMRRDFSL